MKQLATLKGLALVLVAVAAISGCRRNRHSTTFVSDDDIFTTDDFPGAPVQDGNVASDHRAMSNAAEYASSVVVRRDGRGHMIVMYITNPDGLLTPPYHVYAHYFDGENWTPPVAIRALDTDLDEISLPCTVAFLNTEDDPRSKAQERDGDAVLLWLAMDLDDDGPATADGPNMCLFATYFDVTHAADADHRYGFQELAVRLTVNDMADESSFFPAIVTDGTRGEQGLNVATFAGNYACGDPTTGLVACWTQKEDNDLVNPAIEDTAAWYASWDLGGGSDPEVPLAPSPSTRLAINTLGASDSGIDSEETLVGQDFQTYNNLLFFRVVANENPFAGIPGFNAYPLSFSTQYGFPFGAEDDVVVETVSFNLATGTPGAAEVLSGVPPDATDALATQMSLLSAVEPGGGTVETPAIFGSDEGLAQMLVVVAELDADADTSTFGSGVSDGYLKVIGMDEATAAYQSAVIVSIDDPTIFDTVDPMKTYVQISRNGDYLWIAYLQPDSTGASDDLSLRCVEIVTTRPADDGTFTLGPVGGATSVIWNLEPDIDGFDVEWFQFQAGLGYVCGSQSDPDVMSLFCEHSDASEDAVVRFRLTADLALPPVPTITFAPVETFTDDEMNADPVNFGLTHFGAVDGGSGGDVVAFYRQDVDPTSVKDYRLFAERLGALPLKVEIGSADPDRFLRDNELTLVVTPAGTEIGTFDVASGDDSPDRPHPAEIVHVLFGEARYEGGVASAPALRTRALDLRDDSASIDASFTPPVGAMFQPPFDLDLPGLDPGPSNGAYVLGSATDGNSVGVWFPELGHVYYQEFDSDSMSWRTKDDVSAPWLIDDDSPVETHDARFHPERSACEHLHGAAVFWSKDLDGGGLSKRVQVRIRE